MLTLVHIAGIVSFLTYIIAAVIFLATVLKRSARMNTFCTKVCYAAFIAQTVALLGIVWSGGVFALVGSGGDYYFLFSWALALSFLVGTLRFPYPMVGAFVVPAIACILGASSYVMHLSSHDAVSSNIPLLVLILHVVPALCAEVSLFFAFVVSALYLSQERRLRQKSMDTFSLHGPSLERLDFLQGRFVLIGFVAMSFAVLSGTLWGVSQQVSILSGSIATWASFAAWILLGVLLYFYYREAWSPRRRSRVTAVIAGCYFLALMSIAISGGGVLHAFDRLS